MTEREARDAVANMAAVLKAAKALRMAGENAFEIELGGERFMVTVTKRPSFGDAMRKARDAR
jgi:hypothetical protein